MGLPAAYAFILLLSIHYVDSKEFIRLCYFASWAKYRPSEMARHDITDIDPNLCTHLVYAFGKLDMDSRKLVANDPNNELSRPGFTGRYSEFNNLKTKNSRLKTLLSVGGEIDGSDGFKAITQTDAICKNFSEKTVEFLRENNFDGFDVDWEYPTNETKDKFVRLIKALREAFDADQTSPKLLLTVAGPAGKWTIEPGFDVPAIARYVDYVNVMTYDYTVGSSEVAAFNSPLWSRHDPKFNQALSTNYTVHFWNQLGLPFNKMLIGFTGVGRLLVLEYTNNTKPGAPVTGDIRKGDYYQLPAGLAYPEICLWLDAPDTMTFYDDDQQVPYLVKDDNWVGYENERSLAIKIPWMMKLGAAGVMFWSLDQDDFSGKHCDGNKKYPLMSAVKTYIDKVNEPQITNNPNPDITTISKKDGAQSTNNVVYLIILLSSFVAFVAKNL